MKTLTVLFAACLCCGAADSTVAKVYDSQLRSADSEIVSLVQAMPAEKFGFAPKDGEFKTVRTFGQQAKHISAVLYGVSAVILGEKPPVDPGKDENGPASIESKEQIVQFMKDAFAYAHKALGTMTPEREVQMVKSPFGNGEIARGFLAGLLTWHSFDHYGQMVVYARMNGVVPPASK
jgi:uncharacterized damage-inducible protein DinB